MVARRQKTHQPGSVAVKSMYEHLLIKIGSR